MAWRLWRMTKSSTSAPAAKAAWVRTPALNGKRNSMAQDGCGRIAILYPGDYEVRRNATTENDRFADLFRAFAAKGIDAEPAVYHDDFCAEVREQLIQVNGVLVWFNPIQDGRNRSILDSM